MAKTIDLLARKQKLDEEIASKIAIQKNCKKC